MAFRLAAPSLSPHPVGAGFAHFDHRSEHRSARPAFDADLHLAAHPSGAGTLAGAALGFSGTLRRWGAESGGPGRIGEPIDTERERVHARGHRGDLGGDYAGLGGAHPELRLVADVTRDAVSEALGGVAWKR